MPYLLAIAIAISDSVVATKPQPCAPAFRSFVLDIAACLVIQMETDRGASKDTQSKFIAPALGWDKVTSRMTRFKMIAHHLYEVITDKTYATHQY